MADEANSAGGSAATAGQARGMLTIVSGPSGVGKSTLTNRLIERLPAALSISMTTRPRAAGDRDGHHYHFVDTETFERAIGDDAFLEWAKVYENYYGTPRKFVEERLAGGDPVVLEIDVDGATQVKSRMPDVFAVFILPPSDEALLERLRSRGRDDEATIQRRFSRAKSEFERAEASGTYAAFVVNDDFERAAAELESLVRGEMQRRAGA